MPMACPRGQSYSRRTMLVAINGVRTPPQEATLSIFDRGFLFGDAVYDVIGSLGKNLFQLVKPVAGVKLVKDLNRDFTASMPSTQRISLLQQITSGALVSSYRRSFL